ncbi:hypothetical protein G9A89_014993 [Geosiphon pyriformis]|nr:hypothetical protein G9A89_014993 [Geosiphon pyriformis]
MEFFNNQNPHLTEDEAELYDRQIRLWGIEAQQRMRNSNILIVGMRGLSNEVCKNLVLAGVGAVTILDYQIVTEEDFGAQFFLRVEDLGKNRAIAAAVRVRELNPRVAVTAETDNLLLQSEEFLQKFDVICLTNCDISTLIKADNLCRKFEKKFYAASAHGLFGYIFCDLKQHEYIVERKEIKSGREDPEVKRTKKYLEYVSLGTALSKNDWSAVPFRKLRKVSPLLWANQILWKFQEIEGRLPIQDEDKDFAKLKSLRDTYLPSMGVEPSLLANELLSIISRNLNAELSPVCAIVGGILAQDILKGLSQKDLPINNFFFYNGLDGSGLVYQVEPEKAIF